MSSRNDAPVLTVEQVDLQRYLGTWYEIARKPMWAEDDGARDITATYEMKDNGRIRVLNRCLDEDGKPEESEGEAVPVDAGNAKLTVSFLPKGLRWVPFTRGDYWIMRLDPGYNIALVGTPDRKYLWLLARNANLDEATVADWLHWAAEDGFDLSDIIRPRQSGVVHWGGLLITSPACGGGRSRAAASGGGDACQAGKPGNPDRASSPRRHRFSP